MERQNTRKGLLLLTFVAGVLCVIFGRGYELHMIPLPVVGGLFIAVAILGVFGVNVWYGGPLDPRADPKPVPPPQAAEVSNDEAEEEEYVLDEEEIGRPFPVIDNPFRDKPNIFYRILGAIAAMNQGLQSIHMHGLPGSDFLFVVLGLLTGAGLLVFVLALREGADAMIRSSSIFTMIALPVCVLLGWLKARRNMVFQRQLQPYPTVSHKLAVVHSQHAEFNYTGNLWYNEQMKDIFTRIPAELNIDAIGDRCIIALINDLEQSTLRSDNIQAFWTQSMRPGKIIQVEAGRLYFGLSVTPALRVRFFDQQTGRPDTAVLSCDDYTDCALLATLLR